MDSIVYTCYDRDQNVVKKHIAASVCAEMKYVGVTRTTRGVGTPFYDSFPFIDIGELNTHGLFSRCCFGLLHTARTSFRISLIMSL